MWQSSAISIIVLSLAAPSGCSAPPPPPPKPPPQTAPPAPADLYVLVPQGAWLYIAPYESAERVREYPGMYSPDDVRAFHVVANYGRWLGVEPLDLSVRQCKHTLEALSAFSVQLFVEREALALVTTREVRAAYRDGTSITLDAGVPLVPSPFMTKERNYLFAVFARGLMFNLPLPPDVVGWTYEPPRHRDIPEAAEFVRDQAVLSFGEGAIVGRIQNFQTLFVYGRRDLPDGPRVTLRNVCGEYAVRVDPAQIQPFSGYGGLLGRAESPSGAHARAGARVYWADGNVAGVTRQDAALDKEIAPGRDRRCFQKSLRMFPSPPNDRTKDHLLRMCFDAADVKDAPAPPQSPAP